MALPSGKAATRIAWSHVGETPALPCHPSLLTIGRAVLTGLFDRQAGVHVNVVAGVTQSPRWREERRIRHCCPHDFYSSALSPGALSRIIRHRPPATEAHRLPLTPCHPGWVYLTPCPLSVDGEGAGGRGQRSSKGRQSTGSVRARSEGSLGSSGHESANDICVHPQSVVRLRGRLTFGTLASVGRRIQKPVPRQRRLAWCLKRGM